MPDYPFKETTLGFTVTGDMLNQMLYGDARKATRWELFVFRWRVRLQRIPNAWAVLCGREHIGDW